MPDALRKSQPAPLGEENKSVTFFFKGRNKYGVPLFVVVNCFLQHNPCLQGAGLFRLTDSHYV